MNSYNSYEYQIGWSQGYFQAMNKLQEKRKMGKWIDLGKDKAIRWQCSECGRKDTHIYNYCPDCGSKNGD